MSCRSIRPLHDAWQISLTDSNNIEVSIGKIKAIFRPEFVLLNHKQDPKLALRPNDIPNVRYNLPTWKANNKKDILDVQTLQSDQKGDGFDDRILEGKVGDRTANLFEAGHSFKWHAQQVERIGQTYKFIFPAYNGHQLKAEIALDTRTGLPKLTYNFTPADSGYYSIGFVGAPKINPLKANAIWQPMIWNEKRFPDRSYMTLAFRCPLPTTLVQYSNQVLGVIASPEEFPFQPLPRLDNSRFGVALRNEEGKASPMLFSPVLGGEGSFMIPNDTYTFNSFLYVKPSSLTDAYEDIARRVYQFSDIRTNTTVSLNRTFENIIDYGMSKWSFWVDSLKGCGYSTDVPGAVKNVSSLNPLTLALATDRSELYHERAYPTIEYMMSREKFLFSLDPKQKIQSPSRNLTGPAAPVSELASLYQISEYKSNLFVDLAQKEYYRDRARNLEYVERGDRWQNTMALYRATKDSIFLKKLIAQADKYLMERVKKKEVSFGNGSNCFFWPDFSLDWISMLELYEETGKDRYIKAAHQGARDYLQYIWFAPQIPSDTLTVNPDGQAPAYWYLASKGHIPMEAKPEKVAAWRLSEIGLTPESSGTCSGHRAIFMANYAPWLLRICGYTDDQFLREVARSAIIGRYENFPGYHMNTARTTVYEKKDYPLRPFKELSVNSFHFNHIFPLASTLLDYLVADTWLRSEGEIDFPSVFIEGYAYLQNKGYGHKKGIWYGDSVNLWMPSGVIELSGIQTNYLTARVEGAFYVAFLGENLQDNSLVAQLNQEHFSTNLNDIHVVEIWKNGRWKKLEKLQNGQLKLNLKKRDFQVFRIKGLNPISNFQEQIFQKGHQWNEYKADIPLGKTHASIISIARQFQTFYAYLEQDDQDILAADIFLKLDEGEWQKISDKQYPFEFTLSVPEEIQRLAFYLEVKDKATGAIQQSEVYSLSR